MKQNTSFEDTFSSHLMAGCPGLYIQSGEEARIDQLLTVIAAEHNLHVIEWNLGYGQVNFDNKQPVKALSAKETDLASGLAFLQNDNLENKLIVIKNAALALENNGLAIARLKQLLNRIQRHHKGTSAVVLVSERLLIPVEIETQITLLPLPLPTQKEINSRLDAFCVERALTIHENILSRISITFRGLSEIEIDQVLSMVTRQYTQIDDTALEMILREKEQIIAKSGVLEMVKVSEKIEDIGGLENLKGWLKRRAAIIHRLAEAEQFGIKAPKGVLIAGMPGCGKSLTAKVAANLFQLPLLRLDIGSLLGKYVGESEHNMRRALRMAEAVSPCILWVDELEKAFVGMGGNNASEVTSRLLGYFLTWMQEKTGSVFVIATANDISALPPELMRKGRFDETFYVGFPNHHERQEILSIHLRKARKNTDSFDMPALASLCRDYSGADIQNSVNEALENAFLDDTPLTQELLQKSIHSTVPLRETLREQVGKYEELFEKRKLKPASLEQGLSVAQMIKMAEDPNQVKRETVAADPDCPDDLLEKLAQDQELEVKKAVYNNSRCPERLLSVRMNIDEDNPEYDEFLRDLACLHVNTPLDLLTRQMGEDKFDENLRSKIFKATHFPEEVLRAANIYIGCNTPIYVLKALALNTHITEDMQQTLLNCKGNSDFMWLLAINEKITESIQLQLAIDENQIVRENLAGNNAITESAQLQLVNDNNLKVRVALAENNAITESTQLRLIKDQIYEVKIALARRRNLSERVQNELLNDENSSIRGEVVDIFINSIRPQKLSEAIQMKISNDENIEIRRLLTGMTGLSEQVKLKLLADAELSVVDKLGLFDPTGGLSESVIMAMLSNKQCLINHQAYEAIRNRKNLSEEAQLYIVSRNDMSLCALLDGDCLLEVSTQEALSNHGSSDVRCKLAKKGNLIKTIKIKLSKDEIFEVRNALSENKNLIE